MEPIQRLLAAVTLLAPLHAQTTVGGSISIDTTWDLAGSPYELASQIVVDGGATLTIEPGVEVHFISGLLMDVGGPAAGGGTLVARGTAGQPILFTSPAGVPGSWESLRFLDDATDAQLAPDDSYLSGSVLQHCIIEFGGGYGGINGTVQFLTSSPLMDSCVVRDTSLRGLSARMQPGASGSTPPLHLRDSWFHGNGKGGINIIDGSHHELTGLVLENNGPASGAGAWIRGVPNLLVENCLIRGNTGNVGGGMYMFDCVDGALRSSVFEDNTGTQGAGLRVNSCAGFLLEGTTFAGNHIPAGVNGGGLLMMGSHGAVIRSSSFEGNSAKSWGGGAHIHSSDDVLVDDCQFRNNACEGSGGGLWAGRPLHVVGSVFDGNTTGFAGGGFGGGGGANAVTYIEESIFRCNSAGRGGGLYADKGSMIVLDGDPGLDLFNVFQGNSANKGSAIHNASGSTLSADFVCWGPLHPDMESNRIWDQTDDPNLAQVLATNPASCPPIGCQCSAEIYCTTSPNSVGGGAWIGVSGSTSVSANDLVLQVTGCPATTPGLFYYGSGQAQTPFGNGHRCVGGTVFRLEVLLTEASGAASDPIDYSTLAASGAIHPGSRWYFQFWYRDPAAGGSAFNLSNGLAAEFCD